MYNNSTHYPNSGYQQSAYPQYQQIYNTSYGYQSYSTQYPNQNDQPVPPGENFSTEGWQPSASTSYGSSQKDG